MNKKGWVWVLIILAGLVAGGLIGEVLGVYPAFSWLNYGKTFGINSGSPMVLNFYVMELTFGLSFNLNVASIIGLILSMVVYKILSR